MKRLIASAILATFLMGTLAGCADKAQTGAGLGALTGATVGALTSKNKVSGAAIGAGIGLLLGYMIGNEMDKHDKEQVNKVLETQPSGKPMAWKNPDSGNQYEATPSPAYVQNDKVYRDIYIKANVDGQEKDVKAKAYRNPDGTWVLVQ
ncbi:MAG: glycine zipper domain-containing protein [Humidesulfovibrio sp.]|jgi:surface antigen|uniref:glycine zipper domain-containing protein n=1 Tax=Humidesulfovibrio sp. TaxID=2910988 RepID=UPI002735DCFF|nr:glycine zipper domain-containing protein [Humidesulfovibrio sp.]MDP2849074.1 glycine zipper domain-containing protein [Humidesulfovibrio sp.]